MQGQKSHQGLHRFLLRILDLKQPVFHQLSVILEVDNSTAHILAFVHFRKRGRRVVDRVVGYLPAVHDRSNLVLGEGLVWNPGERVEGYSNFLWTLAIAAGLRAGLEPVGLSFALGLICFLASLWFGETLGLRGQILVNLVGFFFGGSLLMIDHYGLNPVEAFGLRLPRPSAWVAVLIGTPSALILGLGLAQLVNAYVFPVPQQLLESFGQALMGPDLPLWQLVLFLCIMPGIFEELAFRGVLVYGLRRRFKRTWVMALAVGLIFGIFHVSLFRIVPTAWLGFVLTWVVVLSGSIYPAMVWHALSNALAIVPNELGLFPEDFEPAGWWAIPAAFGLALSMWILARGRSSEERTRNE